MDILIEIIVITILGSILILLGLGFYFLPTLIALSTHNINVLAIFLLNFFTSWTIIGWIGALIWAVIV
jgi:hypothetical protein